MDGLTGIGDGSGERGMIEDDKQSVGDGDNELLDCIRRRERRTGLSLIGDGSARTRLRFK